MTRLRALYIVGILAVAAVGCQSVATTSAKLRNQEGNYDLALKLCREALAANPNDAEAHFQMGFAYSQLDSVALAYEHFIKARELDPKKANDASDNIQHNYAKHYKLGQSAFNRQDYAAAATEFDMATQSDPTQTSAFYNLAVAYSRLAEDDSTNAYHEKALAAADKVLELSNPSEANYTKALQLAGQQLIDMKREEEAVTRFQRLVEEDPSSYQIIQDLGMDLLNTHQWKGASVFLKLAAQAREKIGAEDFNVYYNTGVALYNEGHELSDDPATADQATALYDEAIGFYQKALTVQADEPTTLFNIMVANVAKADWTSASTAGEKYVSVNPVGSQGLAASGAHLHGDG